jgi:hypothetical protein
LAYRSRAMEMFISLTDDGMFTVFFIIFVFFVFKVFSPRRWLLPPVRRVRSEDLASQRWKGRNPEGFPE